VLFSWVGLIVVAIAALVVGVVYAYNHFQTFHKIVNDVASFLKGVFVAAWNAAGAVVDWFSKTVMPYVKKAIDDVISWFSAHKDDFIKAWDTVVKAVQGLAKWFNDNVLSWIKDRIKDLTDWWNSHSKEITEVWNFVFQFIKTEAKVAFDFVKGYLGVLLAAWKVAWGLIKDSVKLVWDVIKNVITLAMHLILNTIGVILDLITGHWSKAWTDLKKLVGNALSDAWRLIKSFGSDAGSLLYDAGKNIIKGLISGIKSMVGAAGNAISDVTSEIKNHLPWSPAKKGPLSGSGAPEIGGRNIVKLMAQGITQATPQIEAAMTHVTSAIKAKQQAAGSANLGATIAAGLTGGGAGVGGAGNAVYMTFDLRDSRVMSDRDMDLLVNKIGKQVATRVLPAGGVRIRM